MKPTFMALITVGLAASACATGTQTGALAGTEACSRIGDTGDAVAAFYHPGGAYSAKKVDKSLAIGRASQPMRTLGADVYVHGARGMNEAYMQRALTCHAALGRSAHPNDPLVLDNGRVAAVSVRSEGSALVVRIEGSERGAADEIWRRARAFAGSGAAVEAEQLAAGPAPGARL